MRHPDWEERLNAVVAKHQALPGEWGKSDCWTLTMDAIRAVRGQGILTKLGKYKSEAAGYRVFAKAGFKTVEEALASVLEPVPVLMAQRGDVGVIERDGIISSGVFTSAGFAVRTIYGRTDTVAGKRAETITGYDLQFFPPSAVKQAFQVR
ncbi:hypothetical protein REJC140_00102 [Pseudorhizobium endolithicum]|uniref:DUF6950 domain-containing protein n=1 Tax=Pseudorhizobium endolithicum TaxID=1191678 RepID=A0ABN7JCL3_9HYPH|nr:hypothetical protein [Pseudorhizobium endolithicum]CAD7023127.1 hypothetical protein REJC140_00102 [Pseudorhizobium endolithicum]